MKLENKKTNRGQPFQSSEALVLRRKCFFEGIVFFKQDFNDVERFLQKQPLNIRMQHKHLQVKIHLKHRSIHTIL